MINGFRVAQLCICQYFKSPKTITFGFLNWDEPGPSLPFLILFTAEEDLKLPADLRQFVGDNN
jgi:hypothetical protein